MEANVEALKLHELVTERCDTCNGASQDQGIHIVRYFERPHYFQVDRTSSNTKLCTDPVTAQSIAIELRHDYRDHSPKELRTPSHKALSSGKLVDELGLGP